VVVTGDKGLCGAFNNNIIKKAEERMRQLTELGISYTVVSVGKKGNSYFQRRPNIPVDRFLECSSLPTTKDAQVRKIKQSIGKRSVPFKFIFPDFSQEYEKVVIRIALLFDSFHLVLFQNSFAVFELYMGSQPLILVSPKLLSRNPKRPVHFISPCTSKVQYHCLLLRFYTKHLRLTLFIMQEKMYWKHSHGVLLTSKF
jgi:ATP synthase